MITKIGSNVRGFKVGDRVGVGCLAASCLECEFCKSSQENYCDQTQFTYNGIFWDGSITYGGYSKFLVADHRYSLLLYVTAIFFFFLLALWGLCSYRERRKKQKERKKKERK